MILLSALALMDVVFIVSLLNYFDVVLYISGVFIIVFSLISIIRPLTTKGKITVCEWIDIAIGFVVTVVLLVPFISSIGDEILRNTTVAISSAVIGGVLTLFGVAITIKYNRLAKEEEYLRQIKPYIYIVGDESWNTLVDSKKETGELNVKDEFSDTQRAKKEKKYYDFKPIIIGCSDIVTCTFDGILINDEYIIKFDYERVLLKGSFTKFFINYQFVYKEEIASVKLILSDLLKNVYTANVNFIIDKTDKNNKQIKINSVYDIELDSSIY